MFLNNLPCCTGSLMDVATNARLSELMWLMKLAAISHLDRQATLNYLPCSALNNTIRFLSFVSFLVFLFLQLIRAQCNSTNIGGVLDSQNVDVLHSQKAFDVFFMIIKYKRVGKK